jgi:4-carboxymuconolactone decarboxylase
MARIEPAGRAAAGLSTRIALYFARRAIARLTGTTTERMVEPLEVYARVPVLFKGYAKLEQATGKLHRLPKRLHALAELKAATLTHCEYCIDMGSAIARQWGLRDEELIALPHHRTSPLFSELDRLVLDYAVGMSQTPVEVPDDLFDELRQHLDEEQILELAHHVALENLRGRFNLALGIGAAGFSEGMVCALPDDAGSP